jgi:4-hydroxy-tetrahydrodipicolinate reductase
MGQTLVRAVHDMDGCVLAGAIERQGSIAIGTDAGQLAGLGVVNVKISGDALEVIKDVDGILDFTTPEASVAMAGLAAQARIVHVIGTTGFDKGHEAKIAAAARHATIVKAGNMSLGVNLLVALTRKVAEALDADFDIEVLEMHHRHKVDAPSGTALMLARAAAEGRHIDLDTHAVRTRDGHTGARPRGHIGFATLRGGSVVGDHTVIFAGEGERVELTHKASDRAIYARGAVKAALWARGRPPGLYSMADVLGIG